MLPLDTPLFGYRNIVTASTVAASSADTSFPASNLANPSTSEKWKASSALAQTITITPATPDAVDYVGIARHNLGTLNCAITLQGRRASSDAFSVISEVVPADDAPLLFRFEAQSFYEIQLSLAGTSAPVEIAIAYCGAILVSERGVMPSHVPLRFGRTTKAVTGKSESGDFLGRIITGRGRETAVEMANLSPGWCRKELDPFIAAGEELPFFYAWRQETYPDEVGYGWLTNAPRPAINEYDQTMQVALQISAIA